MERWSEPVSVCRTTRSTVCIYFPHVPNTMRPIVFPNTRLTLNCSWKMWVMSIFQEKMLELQTSESSVTRTCFPFSAAATPLRTGSHPCHVCRSRCRSCDWSDSCKRYAPKIQCVGLEPVQRIGHVLIFPYRT